MPSLVGWDDVGYNTQGEDWLDFATPNIDALVTESVVLEHHYSSWICGPTRASFLTGRYAARMGFHTTPGMFEANLPLDETTVAQELQAYGYRTALIGKWHMGYEQWALYPTYRGFDTYYGYLSGSIEYFSKFTEGGWFDVHDNDAIVTDSAEMSNDYHLTQLLQDKAEATISAHARDFPNEPLFLYYAMQNVHAGAGAGMEAPTEYIEMCGFAVDGVNDNGDYSEHQGYCALMIMLDEAVGNTVCALETSGIADNMLLVLASVRLYA